MDIKKLCAEHKNRRFANAVISKFHLAIYLFAPFNPSRGFSLPYFHLLYETKFYSVIVDLLCGEKKHETGLDTEERIYCDYFLFKTPI